MNRKTPFSRQESKILLITLLGTIVVVGTVLGFFLFQLYSSSRPLAPEISSPSPVLTETPTLLAPTITETIQPTISFTSTPEVTPTIGVIIYTVRAGDTLSGIAEQYGTSVEAIKQANGLTGDMIKVGDRLTIPISPLPPASTQVSNQYRVRPGDTIDSIAAAHDIGAEDLRSGNFMFGDALLPDQLISIPVNTPVASSPYHFSILEGNISIGYPLSLNPGSFSMHYAPNTFPAQDPQAVYGMIERSVQSIEALFQIPLSGSFDVYVAGSLFEPPNRQLRGISYSVYRRSFFLHDGTGDAFDQQYISAHELTHLYAWNTFGQPASTMLSEGAAVYSGMTAISSAGYISLDAFCAAYQRQGQLPRVSGQLSFTGHIYDLQNYYASGCFVGYLIRTYGAQSFGLLYHKADFSNVYGKTIDQLEQGWMSSISDSQIPAELDPVRLVSAVDTIENSYRTFMPGFSGAADQLKAYRELDLARLSLLRGKFDEMDAHLGNVR